LALLAAFALVAGACGSDDAASDATTTTAAATPDVPAGATIVSVTDDLSAKPEVVLEASDEAPTELVIDDIVEGDGAEAVPGATVEVQYVGQLTDGEQFDASWDNGQPFSFQLDAGMVIPGWDQGVAGMKVGGRRALVIPSDLAYGPDGRPPTIPPAATLVFVVDLLSVTEGAPDTTPVADVPAGADVLSVSDDLAAKPTVDLAGTDTPPVELVVEDIVVGDGAEAGEDSTVEVGYLGLLTDATEFDSSWDGGSPFSFALGGGRVIPGFEEGVRGMKVGGRRVLTIPAAEAYGAAGTPDGAIPPGATLIFVVDLLAVS
jgi:peptidylprolyl isomerase